MENLQDLKQVLMTQGSLTCRIASDSMEPLLHVGDKVQVFPLENKVSLKKFDLLVFSDGKDLMCHFLWHINRIGTLTVTTRSLKRPTVDDPPIPVQNILGVLKSPIVPIRHRLIVLIKNLLKHSL